MEEDKNNTELEVIETRPHANNGDDVSSRPNLTIGTLNVFNSPIERFVNEPFRRRHDRHYHHRHRFGRWHLIADIVLAVFVVALILLNAYVFFFDRPALREKVTLQTVLIPETVRSADVTTFRILYTNDSEYPLDHATLAIRIPGDFDFQSAIPSSFVPDSGTVAIGSVAPGATGSVAVTGQFTTDIGVTELVVATLSYTNSAGKVETTSMQFPIIVRESAFVAETRVPNPIVADRITPFTITYTNRGSAPLRSPEIVPMFGKAYRIIESSAPFTNGRFSLPTLRAGSSGTVTGAVEIIAGERDAISIATQCFVQGRQLCAQSGVFSVSVVHAKVRLEPDDGTPRTVLFSGSGVMIPIRLRNGEAEPIRDVIVTVLFPAPLFGNTDSVLRMSAAEVPELTEVVTNQDVRMKVVVPPVVGNLTAIAFDNALSDGDAVLHTTLSYVRASAPEQRITIEDRLHVPVATNLALDAFARYYSPEGDQLGRGPLPPRVGETTRYWVFTPLSNSYHDLADVVLTAALPPSVEWTGASSVTHGLPLEFITRTRRLEWRVPALARNESAIGIAFELAITPRRDALGRPASLLTDILVRGRDTIANVVVETTHPDILTTLPLDTRATGGGVIRL